MIPKKSNMTEKLLYLGDWMRGQGLAETTIASYLKRQRLLLLGNKIKDDMDRAAMKHLISSGLEITTRLADENKPILISRDALKCYIEGEHRLYYCLDPASFNYHNFAIYLGLVKSLGKVKNNMKILYAESLPGTTRSVIQMIPVDEVFRKNSAKLFRCAKLFEELKKYGKPLELARSIETEFIKNKYEKNQEDINDIKKISIQKIAQKKIIERMDDMSIEDLMKLAQIN